MQRSATASARVLAAVSVATAFLVACAVPSTGAAPSEPSPPAETAGPSLYETSKPDPSLAVVDGQTLRVLPLQHATFVLQWGNTNILVDPVADAFVAAEGAALSLPQGVLPADLVLVTDTHPDHLDPAAVRAYLKPGGVVIAPSAAAAELPEPRLLANGESLILEGLDLSVEAVPMYNLRRTRPDNGEPYHVPGRGNGYLLRRGEATVYLSGDTECTPEMKALSAIDVAFVCMNLPYTMPVDEAAKCVRAFQPGVVFPFHHRGQDPGALAAQLATEPHIEVRVLDWYPASSDPTGEPKGPR